MSTITLSAEQAQASDAIRGFLHSGTDRFFTLHGLAGSGKTTVLSGIARRFPDAILCTLTGKAASILRDKTGLPACTIHSAFYRLADVQRDANGKRTLNWSRQHDDDAMRRGMILLDECSMVDEAMARDLLATGAKIVACGDPGQLPPVKGAQFFTRPDALLREIRRQALESPIIRQAHAVRSDGYYTADGDGFRVSNIASDEDLRSADVILTWTHKTRKAANAEMRRLQNYWMPHPQEGEPVMCLRNMPELGIFNGAVYTLAEKIRDGDRFIRIAVDGEMIEVPHATFAGVRMATNENDERAIGFDYGYAMTVHKAQGSEWDRVILIDEFRGTEADRRKWLYTGITRAASKILVVR